MASQTSGAQESGSAGRFVYDNIIESDRKSSKKTSDKTGHGPGRTLKQKFRLLELLPAKQPHEPIICQLRTSRLDKEEKTYEALSYVWGDDRHEFDIRVGEKRLSVTHNLHTALRHLRREDKGEGEGGGEGGGKSEGERQGEREGERQGKRTMWIDALCINQGNQDEKEAQLAIMPDIYNRAERVVVWLGPAANNSDLAMAFIKGKGAKDAKENTSQKDQKGAQGKKAKKPDKNEEIRERITQEPENRLRRALVAIMEREYWTRVWVVQEIVKATKIELVCGESSTSWEDATVVINEFLKSREAPFTSEGRLLKRTHMSSETWAMPTSSLTTLGHLAGYRETKEGERGPDWLMNMFVQLRRFKSTKQNDKIFSIVGLRDPTLFKKSESFENPDIPDLSQFEYSWSFREVSLRLFKNFIFTQRKQGTGSKRAIGSMNILYVIS
ncbi:hypothetical protein SLS58_006333 [Diplodia intermedia]|uniref:Heterokaryon incompatibility domain-containing protein n=1 Tax=Diplodia intermedia TaxID=856260 RepID=A0ABR3TND5_9PEZI